MLRASCIVSVVVAAGMLIYAQVIGPPGLAFYAAGYLAIPLFAIWFGDPIFGDEAESLGYGWYNTVVRLLGWLLLCLTPLVLRSVVWRFSLGS
jgi:hypothetical protein